MNVQVFIIDGSGYGSCFGFGGFGGYDSGYSCGYGTGNGVMEG